VQIYLDPQQHRVLSRAAVKADKHISQYLREIALREIEVAERGKEAKGEG
jgi:hypothetical protein